MNNGWLWLCFMVKKIEVMNERWSSFWLTKWSQGSWSLLELSLKRRQRANVAFCRKSYSILDSLDNLMGSRNPLEHGFLAAFVSLYECKIFPPFGSWVYLPKKNKSGGWYHGYRLGCSFRSQQYLSYYNCRHLSADNFRSPSQNKF